MADPLLDDEGPLRPDDAHAVLAAARDAGADLGGWVRRSIVQVPFEALTRDVRRLQPPPIAELRWLADRWTSQATAQPNTEAGHECAATLLDCARELLGVVVAAPRPEQPRRTPARRAFADGGD